MTFEAINGDADYRANAKDMIADLQARVVAQAERYESLVAAVSALADEFDSEGSHYHRDRVLSVLVATKEQS